MPGVLDGKNLVYCAPTSGGKSLVAEVLMLRRVLTTGLPAMLVLPYVSLCVQKAAHLQKLMEPVEKTVKNWYGPHGGAPTIPPGTGMREASWNF
jgi:DNA polymerase theta